MKHRVKISAQLAPADHQILTAYWAMENDQFLNRPKDLCKKFILPMTGLKQLVRENSSCEKVYGHCLQCGNEISQLMHSQTDFKASFKNITRCDDCNASYRKFVAQRESLRQQELEQQKWQKFGKAFNQQAWLKLSAEERSVLDGILEHKVKKSIYAHVFNGNPRDKFFWKMVNKLVSLGLVYVDRDSSGGVNGFEFDPLLAVKLKRSADHQAKTHFGFLLEKVKDKQTVNQPEYSGTFTLPEDVVLKAGVNYIFGGWVKENGSINLRFKPIKELEPGPVQTDLSQEPRLAGEILKEMFNDLNDGK